MRCQFRKTAPENPQSVSQQGQFLVEYQCDQKCQFKHNGSLQYNVNYIPKHTRNHSAPSCSAPLNPRRCFLSWINNQRKHLSQNWPIYSLQQLQSQGTVFQLLQQVDPCFSNLNPLLIDYPSYLQYISCYLHRPMLSGLIRPPTVQLIVSLTFSLLMNCREKGVFIERVLELDEETQEGLMREVGDGRDESVSIIESLEEENEEMRSNIREYSVKEEEMMEQIKSMEEENQALRKECQGYRVEKMYVFERFNIGSVREYVEIVEEILRDREEVIQECRRSERENQQLKREVERSRREIQENQYRMAEIVEGLKNRDLNQNRQMERMKEIRNKKINQKNVKKIKKMKEECEIFFRKFEGINYR